MHINIGSCGLEEIVTVSAICKACRFSIRPQRRLQESQERQGGRASNEHFNFSVSVNADIMSIEALSDLVPHSLSSASRDYGMNLEHQTRCRRRYHRHD